VLTQEQSDVSLVIAGDGPDREKMEQMVEELELPNVTFMGYVDDKTKLDLLASADLFCAPAIYGESFGIVLLEAMACGVVTVAGDNSGYSSVLKDTGAVSLVNPRHTVEFARRLQLLLEDEGIRKTWKKWAGSYVKQFSYSNIVDQYEDLYKVALTQHVEA
jgi:phosphatidylinositol alpha-mannosyltransferase